MDENPFDQLGLDPRMTPRELTEELRQRAERALPEERALLQGLWRKLTLKESERIRWALLAHPRTSRASREVDALREKIPPYPARLKLDALVPSAADAILLPQLAATRTLPIAPPLAAPGCFQSGEAREDD